MNTNKWKPVVTIQTYEERLSERIRQKPPETSQDPPSSAASSQPSSISSNSSTSSGIQIKPNFLSSFKPLENNSNNKITIQNNTTSANVLINGKHNSSKLNPSAGKVAAKNHRVDKPPTANGKHHNAEDIDCPPYCPTPDYDSDVSVQHQSTTSQVVKKYEKNIKKTVTFGQNSTKEITPIKNCDFVTKSSYMMSQKSSQDVVEMQSIESFELTEPKISKPKPPPTYFIPNAKKDNKVAIKFCAYPVQNQRKEPNKFEFLETKQNNCEYQFETELATTLSKSNLKSKSDCYMNGRKNYSNGKG